jgi:hypothetical protein
VPSARTVIIVPLPAVVVVLATGLATENAAPLIVLTRYVYSTPGYKPVCV